MSAELWRVIQDLEVGFVAVSCSHVSASIVELLMPQYSAGRNKALQMLEGILGIAFHWMLGVQLFRLLVPLRYHNFPGTVFTVFAPLLLRQQYTKLLVAVQSIAGQTVKLLPSMLGDDSKPKSRKQPSRTPEPLPPALDDWDRIIDDLQKSILTDMRQVMAEAQAAYVDGKPARLDAAAQLLSDVLAEGTQDLASVVQQGNDILEGLAGDARNRKNTVAQWQVSERWKAFKERMQLVAQEVAGQFTAMGQSIDQMKAALEGLTGEIAGLEDEVSKWREGGPPANVPDDPPPVDPSDPNPRKLDYPYPTGSGQGAGYVIGELHEGELTLMSRMEGLYFARADPCGQYHYATPLPLLYLNDPATGHLILWDDLPLFQQGSRNGGLREDYNNGLVVVQTSVDKLTNKCVYPKKASDCLIAQKDYPGLWESPEKHPAALRTWSPRQALLNNPPYWVGQVDKQWITTYSDLYTTEPFVN